MNYSYAIHSDFLIHWTGEDIDRNFDPTWLTNESNKPNKEIIQPYIERLKYTLKFGLWMTPGSSFIETNRKKIYRPTVARTCFTELKLSEAREHASKFGRLGIGFKRMFVFDRMGMPMIYFRPEKNNWLLAPFLDGGPNKIEEYWACYLKSMDEKIDTLKPIEYKQFNESEWRIIYSEDIKNKLHSIGLDNINSYFKKPEDIKDDNFQQYLSIANKSGKLKYLLPLDIKGSHKWFAMIIYPNLPTKIHAENDPVIRSEIRRLKPSIELDKIQNLTTNASYESYNGIMEIDLDACRNF